MANPTGVALATIGMALLLVGGLGAFGYIPFPSLASQSVCIQSIVNMATICSSQLSTSVDSLHFGTYTLLATGTNIGVSSGNTLSGSVSAYYFLASSVTLASSSWSYSTCPTCGSIPISGATNAPSSSVQGLFISTVASPTMTVGNTYTYTFSMTDSSGASSTLSASITPIAGVPTWTATVQTYNGTYSLGSSSGGGLIGFNVYNVETPNFLITITNNAPVSSITLNVSPGGQSLGFSQTNTGGGIWQEAYSTFAVGQYTVTAVINSGGQSITAFSVRMTSINQLKQTGVRLTSYSTSCPYSTSSASSPPYSVSICQVTQGQSLTITNSGCYTNTAVTSSSTTLQGTTCSSASATCSAGGCQATTTYTSNTATTSTGTDSKTTTSGGSSTTSTTSTSTSTTKTTVCMSASQCSPLPILPVFVTAMGAVFLLAGVVMISKEEH